MSNFPSTTNNNKSGDWTGYQKILFRFAFIYFVLQVIPLEGDYYKLLFSAQWLHFHFYDLLLLTRYYPFWGLPGFSSWLVIIPIALAGALAWTYFDKGATRDYNKLYYWLRVLLRYRLAAGVIAFGLIKLFPMQIPYPSLSNFHTTYGQFLPWKIYYSTIGIIPWYESFLGGVEVVAGLLLFNRNTVTFGTGILVGFLGNVLAANFAYDLGEQVYITYLFVIALFLFANDIPRLYSLLIQQRFTIAEKFSPFFSTRATKARIVLKTAFVAFVLLFGISSYSNYKQDPYLLPATPGLTGSEGFYDVKEFSLNNKTIPYSLTDSSRWQNVIFEKWTTLSIKTAQPIKIDETKSVAFHNNDVDRTYEETGVGERWYYSYKADTAQHTLWLYNKNPSYKNDSFLLHYNQPEPSTILLTGINSHGDSVNTVLHKVVKNYLFTVGRRQPVKL